MKKFKDIFVVIPAYNEAKRIGDVIVRTKEFVDQIVVVDDGSKDNTFFVAQKKGAIVLRHPINLGKGAALKTGCDYAFCNGAKKVVVLDADGQHDPKEIPNFLKALKNKDIVFGYRKFDKNMPFIFRFGNSFINLVVKLLYGMDLLDTQCGYRAFTKEAYKKIRWKSSDYSMESEMIANVGKHKLKYKEIQIQTIYSNKYKGTTILDGFKIVFNMILWKIK